VELPSPGKTDERLPTVIGEVETDPDWLINSTFGSPGQGEASAPYDERCFELALG